MEPSGGAEVRSETYGVKGVGIESEECQYGEELQRTMPGGDPPVSGNSFTALLELPPSQAMELLHSAGTTESPADSSGNVLNRHRISHQIPYNHTLNCSPAFPSNAALVERAAKYSVFANGGGVGQDSPGTSSPPSNLSGSALKVKSEPADSNSNPISAQQVSDPTSMSPNEKTAKRKEREKKGKTSSKKSKTVANETFEDGDKLPYVHVRARRGQATDSHSLAERARREKINARMKLLQELVPGCNKISGTALVLDEIINHVQSLQRQVEYLSMRLSAVNPRIDFNLDSLLAAGNGALMDSSYQSISMPPMWPEIQMNGERQQSQQQWHVQSSTQPVWVREEDQRNLITPESSLLSYDSAHSVSLHSSQLKMEL